MDKKLDFSKPLLVLAPLAGYTDLPFRSVVKKFGADLTISEMISSNAIAYNNKKTLKMTEKSDNEDPFFIQLSGSRDDIMARAVEEVNNAQKSVLVKKILEHFNQNISGKTFAIWGLSFKPNTDDMREAPSLVIIDKLLSYGAKINAYEQNSDSTKMLRQSNGVCLFACLLWLVVIVVT